MVKTFIAKRVSWDKSKTLISFFAPKKVVDRFKVEAAEWQDLAKFLHLGKYLIIFGNLFKVDLVLGKVFISLWHNWYAFGQIFISVPKWPNIENTIWPSGHTGREVKNMFLCCTHWASFKISKSPFFDQTSRSCHSVTRLGYFWRSWQQI